MAIDASFEMNDFSQNKMYTDAEVFSMQLYNLLIMVPGESPDDLNKGINYPSYNMSFAEDSAAKLQSIVIQQAADYCDFTISDVNVTLVDSQMVLVIQSPGFDQLIVAQTDGDTVLMSLKSS